MLRILIWILAILGGILLLILLLLLLLLLMKVQVFVDKVPESPLRLTLRYSILRIPILPLKKGAKPKKPPQKPSPPKKEEEKPKKKGLPPILKGLDIGDLICLALDALLKLKDRLVIRRLRVKVLFATGDAGKTGVLLGQAAAITGMILPLLEQNFTIPDFAIDIDGDFQAEQPNTKAAVGLTMYMRPIFALAVALWAAFRFLRLRLAANRQPAPAESPKKQTVSHTPNEKKENVT